MHCPAAAGLIDANAGAHGYTVQIRAGRSGAIVFPGVIDAHVTDSMNATVYNADALDRIGAGTLEVNTDASGQIDLTLEPTDTTTLTTTAKTAVSVMQLRLTGTWSC